MQTQKTNSPISIAVKDRSHDAVVEYQTSVATDSGGLLSSTTTEKVRHFELEWENNNDNMK